MSLVSDIVSEEGIAAVLPILLTQDFIREVWRNLPREAILAEATSVHHAGLTLGEVLGPDAIARIRENSAKGRKPNRELLEKLMDQPYLRRALRNLVQRSIQQFLQQFNPLVSGRKVPGGRVLGSIGRGIAHRAEKAAKMGKSLVEGVGGGLYKQLEEQLQPFLSGFMNRSVQLLSDALFEGEEQARLARDARLHVLDVLIDTPLSELLPPPDAEMLDRELGLAEQVAVHVMGISGYREGIQRLADAIHALWAEKTVAVLLEELKLPPDASPEVLEVLGEAGYHFLSRPASLEFLKAELKAVW